MNLTYFNEKDFQQCDPVCTLSDMNRSFMAMLDNAREHAGTPFILTSAFRSVGHEHKQGRDGTSSHTKGIAVDIFANNSVTRFKVVTGLLKAGFTRIGIGENFVHVDADRDKAQNVMWDYYKD